MKADANLMERNSLDTSNGVGDDHSYKNGVLDTTRQKDLSELIPGEELIADCKIEHGQIKLTSFRIIVRKGDSKWIAVPLKSIESLEGPSPNIKVMCKDVKILEFKCLSESQYIIWESRILNAIKPLSNPLDAFAFEFFEATKNKNISMFNTLKEDSHSYEEHMERDFLKEFVRLGFDDSKVWRISHVNENYELCETYPRHVIVPALFSDDDLPAASDFRVNRRFPAPVWRHKNGAVLARSSQPSIGIFSNRSAMDERLLDSVSQACCVISDTEGNEGETPNEKNGLIAEEKGLLVVDCRTFTSAFANRVRGGGYENIYNYKSAEIRHMNIPNIHTVLQAYTNLRTVLFNPTDESKRLLKNEDWYDTISNIIFSALEASEALEKSRPVLVHCSDGWDRTPQITSLTSILLDPFYRTIRGFQTLVEREFIDFGHKFGERNEVVLKTGGEKSPIFLQFLECVYQLMVQFPTEFEFNNEFLMKLAQHIYSNLFGDFLFNTSCDRSRANVRKKTFSVWCLFNINRQRFINILYDPVAKTIKPSAFSVNLVIWKPFYVWYSKFLLTTTAIASGSDQSEVEPKRSHSYSEPSGRTKVYDQDFELVELEDFSGLNLKSRSSSLGMCWDSYMTNLGLGAKEKKLILDRKKLPWLAASDNLHESKPKNEPLHFHKFDKELIREQLCLPSSVYRVNMVTAATIDGLNFIEGDVERILLEKKVQVIKAAADELQLEVIKLKVMHRQLVQNSCTQHENVEDQRSLPDSLNSGSLEQECPASDSSWETVEATDNPANWTPDHAASYCMDCQEHFWTGLRKHHCRNCGKVFCDNCTRSRLPVPKENLHVPVRVCRGCVEHQGSPPRSPPMAVSN